MLDLYKLEIFSSVVEEGSFTAASERLLMTQSGVSQHIKDLESALGAHLFQRSRRGAEPTESGKILYDYSRRIFQLVAEAETKVTDVARLASGQVRIEATPGVSIYLLSEWVQTFRDEYPRLTVTLRTKITPAIVQELLAHRADVGFVEGELDERAERLLSVYELESIDQYVVVGQTHTFWKRRSLGVHELDDQTFVMRQPASQTRVWLDQMLEHYQVRPRIGAEFDNVESIKRSVAAGRGLTILPQYAVGDEQSFGTLRTIPIEHTPFKRTLKLIWNARRYFSPVTRSLLFHLRGPFPRLQDVLDQAP